MAPSALEYIKSENGRRFGWSIRLTFLRPRRQLRCVHRPSFPLPHRFLLGRHDHGGPVVSAAGPSVFHSVRRELPNKYLRLCCACPMSSIAAATLEPVEGPAPVSWSNTFVKATIPSSQGELKAQSDCSSTVCSRLTKNDLFNLLSSLLNQLIDSPLSIFVLSPATIAAVLASWPVPEPGP